MWTEMESWKEKAAAYWNDGLRVEDISVLLEVSRQSISAYLKTLPGYAEERRGGSGKVQHGVGNIRRRSNGSTVRYLGLWQ